MSTRSLTVILNQSGKEIAVMYRHCDGYPTGHGNELAQFLAPFRIENGISLAPEGERRANGMECLAAQIVAHFKEDEGGIYLYPPKTRGMGAEYVYTVAPSPDGRVVVSVAEVHTRYSNDYTKEHRRTVNLWSGPAAFFKGDAIESLAS